MVFDDNDDDDAGNREYAQLGCIFEGFEICASDSLGIN